MSQMKIYYIVELRKYEQKLFSPVRNILECTVKLTS